MRQPGDDSDIEGEDPRGPLDWLEAEIADAMAHRDYAAAKKLTAELHERTARGPRVRLLEADEIFAPRPPTPWTVQALEIAPGPATVIAGYGYSGKTVCLQSLAIELAAGLPIWGEHHVERGRVVHLDWEQGDALTADRYKRLSRALEIPTADLRGWLAMKSFPELYLDQDGATSELCRLCEGAKMAIHDSFRASAPHTDENSSEARKVLDMLARVSERTGCTQAMILHARKAQQQSVGGRSQSIRGSSGLFDAAQSAWVFEGEENCQEGPGINYSYAYHQKARVTGVKREDIALRIEDIARDGNDRWGLLVRVTSMDTLAAEGRRRRDSELKDAIITYIRGNPDCSGRMVRKGVRQAGLKASTDDILATVEELAGAGRIHNLNGTPSKPQWRLK